ncbi:hypothetical protein HHK36_020256 [Tetracentron sinense]|uniref:Uncharacterized protein n=1 Tax=Tetracentron sinense TaxID=13715 RepID=A0A835DBG5_TETSI|nr:hypothetical protein HHK36_020256 [Tetracentron sinense]
MTVGEGKVVIATDHLIKLSTDEVTWSLGSAGFDVQGNIAFMGIPTPEIYESPRLTTVPIRKTEKTQVQLLDINSPPRIPKATVLPQPILRLPPNLDGIGVMQLKLQSPLRKEDQLKERELASPNVAAEISSTGSVNGKHLNGERSEVKSSSSLIEVP